MTSLLTNQKVNVGDIGYFINLGDLRTKIYQRTEPNPAGSNTGTLGGSFSTAVWANSSLFGTTPAGWLSTSLATAGSAILRDMGRTVVSANRTFRKIQYVVPANRAASTFGVSGTTTAGEAYFTGYIELGLGEGSQGTASEAGGPAPVAHYGR
jgi:hypothetical protein